MPETRCVTCGEVCICVQDRRKVLVSPFNFKIYFSCSECIELLAQHLEDGIETDAAAKSDKQAPGQGQDPKPQSDTGGRESPDQ